jgi:hypothetical protein
VIKLDYDISGPIGVDVTNFYGIIPTPVLVTLSLFFMKVMWALS